MVADKMEDIMFYVFSGAVMLLVHAGAYNALIGHIPDWAAPLVNLAALALICGILGRLVEVFEESALGAILLGVLFPAVFLAMLVDPDYKRGPANWSDESRALACSPLPEIAFYVGALFMLRSLPWYGPVLAGLAVIVLQVSIAALLPRAKMRNFPAE